MKEILVIAPMRDIYDKAQTIVAEENFDNVEVIFASMEDGLRTAREACRQGASILVTRGGTYEMLCKEIDVPIVEIKVSAYDVVESIKPILPYSGPVGVLGYKNVVYGFDILEDLLPLQIIKYELSDAADIAEAIEIYAQAGVGICVGDSNVQQVAEALPCQGILISSRKTPIREAITEARRILSSIKAQKRRSQQIIAVTDFMHDGILAIDERGVISIFNHSAEEIFQLRKEDVLDRNVRDVLPQCLLPDLLHADKPRIGNLLNVGTGKVAINRAPILVDGTVAGAVATFQTVAEIQDVEQKIRRSLADRGFSARFAFEDIIHNSPTVARCIATAKEYAQYDTPVLIMGESGVGKELFCQSIHNSSPRRAAPFVAINCAAIPPSLIEAELFGYEQGSFTGAASKGRAGIFELAHKGTVFLDEIGELPLELQGRLLRVLQEKTIMRLGGDKMIPVDVRIICATNKDLHSMAREGAFRKDLFYRIHVLVLAVPSLNEGGPEHILALARYFIQRYAARYHKPRLSLTPDVEQRLTQRRYEGNVRELKGLMERCVILASFAELMEEDALLPAPMPMPMPQEASSELVLEDLRTMEDRYIREVFRRTGGHCGKACAILKISRSTLWRRLGMAAVYIDAKE